MFIVGNRKTKKLVEKSGIYYTGTPANDLIIGNMVKIYGGVAEDYSILRIDDDSTLAQEMLEPVEFNLVWNNNDVVDVDLTPERSKDRLKVTGDADILIMGESIVFTGQLTDKDGIHLPYNGQEVVEIGAPYGSLKIRVTFENGKCIHKFTPSSYGVYSVPMSNTRCNRYLVTEQCKFEVIYDAVPHVG